MYLGERLGHLAYSTLVHPGDTWEEMRESLERYAHAVKARVCPDAPYGLSVRLSAASARTLAQDAGERARFRGWLAEHDMCIFRVNAFPYGAFKGRAVMENVYEPDWSTEDLPIFLDDLGDFRTTQPAILAAVAAHAENPLSDQVEIETYTWDVLPSSLRSGDITDNVIRELEWLRDALRTATAPT
jgi:hypothetical protein